MPSATIVGLDKKKKLCGSYGRQEIGSGEAARDCEKRYEEAGSPGWATASASHSPLLKIPVWWRRAVLPSLPWVVCFLSFFSFTKILLVQVGTFSHPLVCIPF